MYFKYSSSVTTWNFLVPVVLHTLSFFLSQTAPFFPSQKDPLTFASLPLFIGTFLVLIFTAVMLPAKFLRIFFFTLSVSSFPFSWNSDFWGVFVLFRLSHMHSMRQKLGENSLINAEVKIFSLLACSESFPWFQTSSRNHIWIIRAPCFE